MLKRNLMKGTAVALAAATAMSLCACGISAQAAVKETAQETSKESTKETANKSTNETTTESKKETANETTTESKKESTNETAVSDQEYIEETLNLANNKDQEWTYNKDADAWVLSVVSAVAYPEIEDEQGVSVCVPGAYVKGIDTDGDGKVDVKAADAAEAVKGSLVIDYDAEVTSSNGQVYTAATAPLILNTGAAGYGSQSNRTASTEYASEGYINISCGNRGKQDTATDESGESYYTGDAPSCLVDQKNAARFVKYNILLGNLPGNVDYLVSTGGSGGGALAAMFAATSNNPDFYDYEAEAGAAGVYRLEDGSFSTTVTIDGKDYEISDGAWGCIAYSAITSLAEADMAMAFEYNLDEDYSFKTDFQKALAGYLSEEYMNYINDQDLSVKEADVDLDINGDGDKKDTIDLTIEYDEEKYADTNGYGGTYLDLYLAEFISNLQWYADNLDYGTDWTWFDEDGNALSDEEVAKMTAEDKAEAFIEGRYAKGAGEGRMSGGPGGNMSGNGGPGGMGGNGGRRGNMGGNAGSGENTDENAGSGDNTSENGTGGENTDGTMPEMNGEMPEMNGERPEMNGTRPEMNGQMGTPPDMSDNTENSGQMGTPPDQMNTQNTENTESADAKEGTDTGSTSNTMKNTDDTDSSKNENTTDKKQSGEASEEVGTPDAGTTQSNTGSGDSKNYSSYEEMLKAYEEDIAEILKGDEYGNNIVSLYNPLEYIGSKDTEAPTWVRIVMGASEGDMSMLSSLNLQLAWLENGTDAEIEWQWDGGHVPSEVLGNSFSLYVDQMYGEYVEGAVKVEKKEAEQQTKNGTAEEATGKDISSWVKEEDGQVSFTLADAASYRTAGASKAVPGFDVIDYGQEDYVFGSSEKDARHWDETLLEVLKEHQDELEKLFNK